MSVVVRPLREADLDAAQNVHRLAFAKFFGLDPANFRPGNRILTTRTTTHPGGGVVAEEGGEIVGSAVVMSWGTIAIVGPISVHPERWTGGVGRALTRAVMEKVDAGGFSHAVLHTHPRSPTHLRLYESFGFWPGALTAMMERGLAGGARQSNDSGVPSIDDCRQIASRQFDGLDLTREIEGLHAQKLGALVGIDGGFAVCHFGPGSEAHDGALYVKFAAVAPGDEKAFTALVDAFEGLAAKVGAQRVTLGVNCARRGAYRALLSRGYRAVEYGVAMHRPDGSGWDLPDRFVIDDLR